MDKILMPLYRFPDNPLYGYYLGTLILSLICVILGEYSAALAYRLNKANIIGVYNEIMHFQNLSIEALKRGDKTAYEACNKVVNNAFGKAISTRITLSASSLWPIFIALGWVQHHFAEIEFSLPVAVPGVGNKVGYLATFILCYITTRILFVKVNIKL
jgi:hypothetical protein